MAENKNDSSDTAKQVHDLDVLPGHVRETVKDFTDKLLVALGDNLKSVTIVGSSLTKDFVPGHSDINSVLVLNKHSLAPLNAIALLAKPMSRKKISAPLLMTPSYIERSRDVFGVELLDLQLTHQTILGEDPFSPLTFDKKDVRLQCERELKATLIRLRQGYIASAANRKIVRDILISTAKAMAPLLRAMLWLKDTERDTAAASTFKKAATEFPVNTGSLIAAGRWRREKTHLGETEMQSVFESVYSTVDKLANIVDKLKV